MARKRVGGAMKKSPLISELYGRDSPANQLMTVNINKILNGGNEVSNRYYGLEIEVEHLGEDLLNGVQRIKQWWNNKYKVIPFYGNQDASLKALGYEFCSYPLCVENVPTWLNLMFTQIKDNYANAKFTERCSIHVHMDATTMSIDEIVSLSRVYMVFEEAMFSLVDPYRQHNPFCRPMANTDSEDMFPPLGTTSRDKINQHIPAENDAKYSAFNPCPLRDWGTIEFRHMHGTWDVKFISAFVGIIDAMKRYVTSNRAEDVSRFIIGMNTISNYHQFAREVLGDLAVILYPKQDFQNKMEAGVLHAKRLILGQEKSWIQPAKFSQVIRNPILTKIVDQLEEQEEKPKRPQLRQRGIRRVNINEFVIPNIPNLEVAARNYDNDEEQR